MSLSGRFWLSSLACALIVCNPGLGRAQDCSQLVSTFNQQVEAGRESEAQSILDRIAVDARCGQLQVAAQRRLAAFRLQSAQTLMARGRPFLEYERLLTQADRPNVLWQAAATMGDVRFGERRFVESALAYDRAIEIVKNETLTPVAPSKFEVEGLFERAAQSRILAANAGKTPVGSGFVKTARNERDGKLGGLYSPGVRGITLLSVPVPITFEFARAAFTDVGTQAAQELATAIKEQRPSKVTLVGHTDVRGGAENNMKLSQARAAAVAEFLRQSGVEVSIDTIGKGASEPIRLSDTSGLSQEDIYALNRRVEWLRDP